MNPVEKPNAHTILLLLPSNVQCSCGVNIVLPGSGWGIKSGYDRLLDLHAKHKEDMIKEGY